MKLGISLIMIASVLLTGATCVTSVDERGPAGPWVGEVVNTGDEQIAYSTVEGSVRNSDGYVTAVLETITCPSRLQPGESGTWEFSLSRMGYNLAPPLTASFRPLRHEGGFEERLSVSVVSTDRTTNSVVLRVRNQTNRPIGGLTVCGSMRSPGGDLLEVMRVVVVPSQLDPAQSTDVVVRFSSIADGATFEFFAEANPDCCGLVMLDRGDFRVTARQFANAGSSDYPEITRALLVVGELRNTSGRDLTDLAMTVQVKGDPSYRALNLWPGCAGYVAEGDVAPVSIFLPLRPGTNEAHAQFEIVGIQANPSQGEPFERLPVRDLEVRDFDVSGEIVNDTGGWVLLRGACFLARDGSRLIGTSVIPYHSYLAPGETLDVTGNVGGIDGTITRNEIIAYAEPVDGPPPPPPPIP